MTLTTLMTQLILTIPLTFIIGYINKKENNTINKIIFPTVYMILISALIPSVKENVFLIVVFEIFIRNFYVTNFSNKVQQTFKFILESIASVAISLLTYNNFIVKTSSVLPTPESIKPFLWFLIVIYLYNISKQGISKINNFIPNKKEINKENIVMQYAKNKNKYHNLINSKNDTINNLIYAIIIYNSVNKPLINRKITELTSTFRNEYIPFGIMQYPSKEKITNEESILLSIKEFENKIKGTKLKEEETINKILETYIDIDKEQIKEIYQEITNFNKT